MVKGVATSIITVAVLMGSLVACSGSDSEVAELRAELEEVKAELDSKEAPEQQPTPPPTPTPIPVEPEPTPQTFFEYSKYDISIDLSTDAGSDKFSLLNSCLLDWVFLMTTLEFIESQAEFPEDGVDPDVEHIASTFRMYKDIMVTNDEGRALRVRMGRCSREFGGVFGPFSRFGDQDATPTLIYKYFDSCAIIDIDPLAVEFPLLAFAFGCVEEKPEYEIGKTMRAVREINESNEAQAFRNQALGIEE